MDMKTQTINIGGNTINAGEKKSYIQMIDLDETRVELPVFIINGMNEGPTLVISGGVHGAEYASIEAALQLGQGLQPADIAGQLIILPVMNMPAFQARSIYVCPLDGINLNRVFPGKAGSGKTEQLAYWVFENVIRQADYYIDMHGGDLVEALAPFTIYSETGNAEVDEKSKTLAAIYGIRDIVKSTSKGSTIAGASGAGIPAILTEVGGQGIWTPDMVEAHVQGVERVLSWLGMKNEKTFIAAPMRILNQFIWLSSEATGYYYPQVKIGDKVKKGQQIAQIKSFEGNVLQEVIAPADGEVLFLVSSLAINQGDPLLSIGAV